MTRSAENIGWKRVPLVVWVIGLAFVLNLLTWIAASLIPDAHRSWGLMSMFGCVLLGFTVGRPWALLVTFAYGVIHAIPVYLGLLPGYLSSWGEALWWAFALVILLALTGLGVLGRRSIRWLRGRSSHIGRATDGVTYGSQPIRSETNATSSAPGSRR